MILLMILGCSIYFSICWMKGDRRSIVVLGISGALLLEKYSAAGNGIFFLAMTLVFSSAYVYSRKLSLSISSSFLLVLLPVFFTAVLFQVIDLYVFNRIPATYIVIRLMQGSLATVFDFSQMSVDTRFRMEEVYKQTLKTLPMLGPFFLFFILVLFTVVSTGMIKLLTSDRGIESFRAWRWTDGTVFALIIGWLAYIFGKKYYLLPLMIFGLNLRNIAEVLYLIQGLAILAFWFNKYKFPKISQGLFYFLMLMLQDFVAYVGVFDTWFDFRGLTKGGIKSEDYFKR